MGEVDRFVTGRDGLLTVHFAPALACLSSRVLTGYGIRRQYVEGHKGNLDLDIHDDGNNERFPSNRCSILRSCTLTLKETMFSP
jgi:hypothetical protein